MSYWTDRILLAFPVDLFGTSDATLDQINALSYIVDPDSGGLDTFSADRIKKGHFVAETQFTEEFVGILGADVAAWQTVLADRAHAKHAEPLSSKTVATLHDGMLFGDAARAATQQAFFAFL